MRPKWITRTISSGRNSHPKLSAKMHRNDVEQFRNLHSGAKCYVCGAGVSIGAQDLSSIHSDVVICVNSAALLMPWHELGETLKRFWVSTDVLCAQWNYFWEKVVKFDCTRVVRESWARQANLKMVDLRFYAPRKTQRPEWDQTGLLAGSSILSAIDLSLLMGCKKIVLLGVDHQMINGKSHFWQLWPKKDRPRREGKPDSFAPGHAQQTRVFASNMRQFSVLNTYAKSLGATIYNASPSSVLKDFCQISIEQASLL